VLEPEPAVPEPEPELVVNAGRSILAMINGSRAVLPAPSPFTQAPDGAAAGRAILSMVQGLAPQSTPALDSDAVAFWQQLTGGGAAPQPPASGADAGRAILSMVQQQQTPPQPPPPQPAPISVAELEAKMGARMF
jgi:hypothetical protein